MFNSAENTCAVPPAPVILIILDGWGIAQDPSVSAVDQARLPFYRSLLEKYPHNRLRASEEAVGLPKGQMGNSEVGHMNIGAGRVVPQELIRIAGAIENGDIEQNPDFTDLIRYVKEQEKPLHLIGLVSDGGVHSSIEHLFGLLKVFQKYNIPQVYIHAFTDGRDTDPRSGKGFLEALEAHCQACQTGRIASIIGRYYAMDRNHRWERTEKAYDLLIKGEGQRFATVSQAMQASYDQNITDEFIEPCVILPEARIKPGDAVLNFNFRTDRGRQITEVLTQHEVEGYDMHPVPLHYVTMTRYDDTYTGLDVLFDKENLSQTLGEVLAQAGKKQIRIAETEKYPHVTFFFNGGREEPFENEKRILCPSPKVATYDLQPEMSAYDIRDQILPELEQRSADFICLNFANADMVGHTGNFSAAIRACEAVDECLKDVVTTAIANGYRCVIIADHGNADKMLNPDGTPNTAHTLAEVPFILAANDADRYQLGSGVLGDVAPTILQLMNIPQPPLMTGKALVQSVAIPMIG
jgi:2,3-bisphosphoglycerate-independent phosphoglycerate mutase